MQDNNEIVECSGCGHDFLKSELQGFNSKDFCKECFEIEHLLSKLEKDSIYLINLDKHVINDVQKLPFEFNSKGIEKNSFNIPAYPATKIASILHDYIIKSESQTIELFNSNFILIDSADFI